MSTFVGMAACCSAFIFFMACKSDPMPEQDAPAWAIAIHGGAGVIERSSMDAETEQAYRVALDSALTIGEAILNDGGTSLDAVEAVVGWMEDNPLFNAGRGAVFTHEGRNELDASIMDGSTRKAGAVGGVRHVRHPVRLARAIMDRSPHVFLIGNGAETFAAEQGLELVDSSWFFTERRWQSHLRGLESEKQTAEQKHGTVGAVALDRHGNLAAATSTGGMTNKRWNRVGDTPVIGAGTFADNATCAVSCTGHGEFFIRWTVARDIAAMMEYGGASLAEAADRMVMDKLARAGGEGGVIAVDRKGHVAMPFNAEGMYRGYAVPGRRFVGIFKDETDGSSR
jgi:beta-aspartyl-peptidase (threonine type)